VTEDLSALDLTDGFVSPVLKVDGKVDRVTYRLDRGRTPGWYAYLDQPQQEPRLIR